MKEQLRSVAFYAAVNLIGILAMKIYSQRAFDKRYRESTAMLKKTFEEYRRATDWQNHVASAEAILNEED